MAPSHKKLGPPFHESDLRLSTGYHSPRPANLLPINGHGGSGSSSPIFVRDASDPGNKRGRGRRVAERTKPGVINGWDSIWGQSTFSPSSRLCSLSRPCLSFHPSDVFRFFLPHFLPVSGTSTPLFLHTPSPRYILRPPFTIFYHSPTITSRVRNTGILESFKPFPLHVHPVDILAYLPIFTTTRTTRLELVRALASLLMQLSD